MSVLGIAILAAVVVFVAWPLFSKAGQSAPVEPVPVGEVGTWERQKMDAYSAIRELEFDFRMGKLSETDFQAMRQKYTARALEAIAALEETRSPSSKPKAVRRPETRVAFCPGCGTRLAPGARFCSGCGQSLEELASAVA